MKLKYVLHKAFHNGKCISVAAEINGTVIPFTGDVKLDHCHNMPQCLLTHSTSDLHPAVGGLKGWKLYSRQCCADKFTRHIVWSR